MAEPFDQTHAGRAVRAVQRAVSGRDPGALSAVTAAVADVLGEPSEPGWFNPAWCTPTVAAVALHIYDERRFHDLPILADALQDAGCAGERVLRHCRGGGQHYRGCWVVDAALGRLVIADGPPHVPKKKRRT